MKLDKFVYILTLLYVISVISVKVLPPLIFLLLSFIGVYIAIKDRINPFKTKQIKVFSWITIIYFFIMVCSVALSNEPSNDWTHLSRKIQFLFAPFLAVVLYKYPIKLQSLIKSIKIGTIFASSIVLIQYILGGLGRLSGMYNPNSFADMLSLLIIFSIIDIANENRKNYSLSLLALLFGAMAIILSGARGSILSFIILIVIFMLLMSQLASFARKRIFFTGLLALVVLFGFASYTRGIYARVDLAQKQISKWENGENRTNAVGIRLEMYKAGIIAFTHSPWIGYGYRNANIVASRYASKSTKKSMQHYTHLHNEIITNMVSAGAVGLMALMLMYLCPIFLAIEAIKQNYKTHYALMVIFLTVGYMLLGMTHGMLEWEYENSFFLYFLAIGMVELSRSNIETKTHA